MPEQRRSRDVRGRALTFVCVLALGLAGADGAQAAITSSRITSPSSPAYLLYDATKGIQHFTVKGEATGSGEVEVKCYTPSGEVDELAEEVKPVAGKFSVEVPTSELPEEPCVMRAVPEGDLTPLPIGAATPFQGTLVAPSQWSVQEDLTTKAVFNYDLEGRTTSSLLSIVSAGACGLSESQLFVEPLLTPSAELFNCNGVLPVGFDPSFALGRSAIQVDTHNAYDVYAAHRVYETLSTKPTGSPSLSVTMHLDESSGLVTIHETDPIVRCSGSEVAFPETTASCTSFVSAGVKLERTWQSASDGNVLDMTDAWTSTDGASHELSAFYEQEMHQSAPGGAYLFGGTTGFASFGKGQRVTLPGGGGRILYKEKGDVSEAAEPHHPTAAIAYEAPSRPDGEPTFVKGTGEGATDTFYLPYSRVVPKTGALTLALRFTQGVCAAVAGSLAEGKPPAACPVSPPPPPPEEERKGGETPPVTTTTTTTAATAAASTPPAAVTASRVGPVRIAAGKAIVTLACTGAAGFSCPVKLVLSTVEHLAGKKITGVTARSRTVVLASAGATIPAGSSRTFVLTVDGAGRTLLARFKRLPALLKASCGATPVFAQSLTIKPAKRRR